MLIRGLFLLISSLGLILALGTVLARNLVHAALFLVGFFFLVACQFVLLECEFLAAMQVLVYIGAVAILLLFGIMLTRNIQGDETTGGNRLGMVLAAVVGAGLLAVLVLGIQGESGSRRSRPAWTAVRSRPAVSPIGAEANDPRSLAVNNMAQGVGNEMMTRFAIPFEVAGLLLTAALVGAIALAQGEGDSTSPRRGAARTIPAGTAIGDTNGHGPAEGETTKADVLTSSPGGPR